MGLFIRAAAAHFAQRKIEKENAPSFSWALILVHVQFTHVAPSYCCLGGPEGPHFHIRKHTFFFGWLIDCAQEKKNTNFRVLQPIRGSNKEMYRCGGLSQYDSRGQVEGILEKNERQH